MTNRCFFTDLADDPLFHIVSFAAAPTGRAFLLCHVIAPLSVSVRSSILVERHSLWSAILHEDYSGVAAVWAGGGTGVHAARDGGGKSILRKSKRLRRTAIDEVRHSHRLLLDRMDIAHFALSEMVISCKDRHRFPCGAYVGYIMSTVPYSVTIIVPKRAGRSLWNVAEHDTLEKVSFCNASRNSYQSGGRCPTCPPSGRSARGGEVTALCVAAARGMPSVVKYLLSVGADLKLKGNGRFRLHANAKKSIYGTHTPRGFAEAMKAAELSAGLDQSHLSDLDKCINTLTVAEEALANE